MRVKNIDKGTPLKNEHMTSEEQRICDEESALWDAEPCLASAD